MILVKASPNGEVRYKPCEVQDGIIGFQHEKFNVQGVDTIKDFPRHIPYNSEKKMFQERTGRDAFEGERFLHPNRQQKLTETAFQYTFRMPGDCHDRDPHVVMWDYNVGLVRITSFFKSLKHPKVCATLTFRFIFCG